MHTDHERDDESIRRSFSTNSNTARSSLRGLTSLICLFPNGQPGQSSILFGIEDFVNAVMASQEPAFDIRVDEHGIPTIHPLPLSYYAKYFLQFLSIFDDHHDYSEHILVFRDGCRAVGFLNGNSLTPLVAGLWKSQAEHANAFNHLIDWIRIAFISSRFRRIPVVRKAQAQANAESIKKYVRNLRDHYCRLTVIRLDFSYLNECQTCLSIDEFYSHLKQFIASFNNEIFKDMVGYAWSVEQGRDKGYHIHFVVFFAGWKVRRDIYRSHLIGQFWMRDITQGAGYYFSCNAKQNEYIRRGVGLFHREDDEGYEDVVAAIQYLTKDVGQHLRMRPSGARAYGHGLI